jgi:hypothetical protein
MRGALALGTILCRQGSVSHGVRMPRLPADEGPRRRMHASTAAGTCRRRRMPQTLAPPSVQEPTTNTTHPRGAAAAYWRLFGAVNPACK